MSNRPKKTIEQKIEEILLYHYGEPGNLVKKKLKDLFEKYTKEKK